MVAKGLSAALIALAFVSTTAAAQTPVLNGRWEIQSLGNYRNVKLEQQGVTFTAYRVMWPEFNGEKYKLEHLYRGRIAGDQLTGELFVREEGVPDYEALRSFKGQLAADGSIVLDGLPLVRLKDEGP